jgi:hypothetical protein
MDDLMDDAKPEIVPKFDLRDQLINHAAHVREPQAELEKFRHAFAHDWLTASPARRRSRARGSLSSSLDRSGVIERRRKRPLMIGSDLARVVPLVSLPVAQWMGDLAEATRVQSGTSWLSSTVGPVLGGWLVGVLLPARMRAMGVVRGCGCLGRSVDH